MGMDWKEVNERVNKLPHCPQWMEEEKNCDECKFTCLVGKEETLICTDNGKPTAELKPCEKFAWGDID